MENRGAGDQTRGVRGSAVDVDLEDLWLAVCMLYLRLKSSFLMMLSLQQNGQKGKSCPVRKKKEVLRVAREQLLGQREAEAAKQARAEERHAGEFAWSKAKPFRR